MANATTLPKVRAFHGRYNTQVPQRYVPHLKALHRFPIRGISYATLSSAQRWPSRSQIHVPEDAKHMQNKASNLIVEIADELASLGSGDKERENRSLFEGLIAVDLIERLGIQRHFRHQIKSILDSVHREWREKSGLGFPEATVLAFRLLRINGYHVSAEVLESFKDDKGDFSCFSIETPQNVSAMLHLYRCSQTAFPQESTIMGSAKNFAETQLRIALTNSNPCVLEPNNLQREVKFALDYPRQGLLPRLESRSIVKQLWPGDDRNRKYLQLAKMDLEACQKLYQDEIKQLLSWFSEVGFDTIKFAHQDIVKAYFTFAAAIYEPEFSFFRVCFGKLGYMAAFLDDIYDSDSMKLQDLKQYTHAFLSWDPSYLVGLPEFMIMGYNALNDTIMEVAEESNKIQGRDMLPSIRETWEELIGLYMKETEWQRTGYIMGFNEYLEVASTSISGTATTLSTVFLTGKVLSDDMLSKVGRGSRFLYLVGCTGRLSNDIVTFKREQEQGKLTSGVSCYMRDNPNCSQEEAIAYLRSYIESSLQELELELFQSRATVPECCSRVIVNFTRTFVLIYKRNDGFSTHDDEDLEYLVKDYLYYPLSSPTPTTGVI